MVCVGAEPRFDMVQVTIRHGTSQGYKSRGEPNELKK